MNELLQQLTQANGVSGDENEIRRVIRDLIAPHVDSWHVDAIGNLIAYKKGSAEKRLRVLVDAHLDEVGLIVTAIDGSGYLEFSTIGHIDPRTLAGQRVQIGREKIDGAIGIRPIHLTTASDRNRLVPLSNLRIDIGAKEKNATLAKVKVGDRVAFYSDYGEFSDGTTTTAIGKAFDNRAGCAALIQLLRGAQPVHDLYACFSVQEEVGLRGAVVAAKTIEPDVVFVLECTPAFDLPNDLDIGDNTALGQGPALYLMDSNAIQTPQLVQFLVQVAESANIPIQFRRPGGGGTNTGRYQKATIGRKSATIGLPGRHAHTANMLINLRDYEYYTQLIEVAVNRLPSP